MSTPQPTPSSPTPSDGRHWIWMITVGLAVAWAMYSIWARKTEPIRPSLGSKPATKVTDFHWSLEDLQGRPVDFSEFQGKTVFLNIWATWCGPCVAEMPSIESLSSNDRLKDVAFVCVSVDKDLGQVADFVASRKMTVRVLHSKGTPPQALESRTIPATFMLDSSGNIVAHEVGTAQWDNPKVVEFLAGLTSTTK